VTELPPEPGKKIFFCLLDLGSNPLVEQVQDLFPNLLLGLGSYKLVQDLILDLSTLTSQYSEQYKLDFRKSIYMQNGQFLQSD